MLLSPEEMREVRGGEIGMVFQEPMTSLNPVLTIGRQITETLEQHRGMDRAAAYQRAVELLVLVGIADGARRLKQYPHQLSGGMRQRVMIAIALACEPKLIIADEPTTALDVTIQAQILELMKALTRRLGVALVIITHNLGVVARYANRVNVMYAGRIVESGAAADIFIGRGIPTRWRCCARCRGWTGRARRGSIRWRGSRRISRGSMPAARSGRAAGSPSRPAPRAADAGTVGEPGISRPASQREIGARMLRLRERIVACSAWPGLDPAWRRRDRAMRSARMTVHDDRRTPPLLEVRGLRMHFPVTEGIVARRKVGEVKAVDGIDFTVARGETLGLVGESGCGKTTTGRCILRLERPTEGEIVYDGVDIAGLATAGAAGAARQRSR